MNTTTVKLLRAASARVGGDQALAQRLGIDELLLTKLMSGLYELPEQVLLGTVDIILENPDSQRSARRSPVPPSALDPTANG